MKKECGIWVDVRNAHIMNLIETEEGIEITVKQLGSEIEEATAKGGTRSKTPYGPQGGVTDRHLEERRHHEEKAFFEEIIQAVDPETDELVIFGPSKAKHGLFNIMDADKHFRPRIVAVESADRMTEHQMKAWVREFFKHPAPRRQPKMS